MGRSSPLASAAICRHRQGTGTYALARRHAVGASHRRRGRGCAWPCLVGSACGPSRRSHVGDGFSPVVVVYTSVLPRARETAEILQPALGGLAAHAECDWCEIHSGSAEGMRYEEMRAKYLQGGRPADPFHRAIIHGKSKFLHHRRVTVVDDLGLKKHLAAQDGRA